MTQQATPLSDAIQKMRSRAIDPDREDRAIDVRAEYTFEYVGCQCWVVAHPDEDDRCYLVDMIQRHCTCPDYVCTASGLEVDCKHILAVIPEWERLTGLSKPQYQRPLRSYDFVPVQDPDPDDPFQD